MRRRTLAAATAAAARANGARASGARASGARVAALAAAAALAALIIGWGGGTVPAATEPAGSGGLQRSGRWFTYNGRPVYLVGFDAQELACDPTVDYVRALDLFVRYRINKVRIWIDCWFGTTSFGALSPWARDASGRADLDLWNPAYWRRVRDVVAQARARAVIVEVTIFSPYPASRRWWSDERHRAAWNSRFNVNGAFSSNGRGHFQPEFFDLAHRERSASGRTLADYQQALVDKAVDELGAFDNVYFEVCNEFGAHSLDVGRWHPWQLHWARRIAGRTSRLVAVHAGFERQVRADLYADAAVDVLNLRFTGSPQALSDALRRAQGAGKVFAVNESTSGNFHASRASLDAAMRVGWGMLLSGGHFALYEDDSSLIGTPEWVAGARRLRALRDIAEQVRFWRLSPVDHRGQEYDALISQGPSGGNRQLLADPGREYLAYFWGRRSAAGARIRLPAGTYAYAWYDARDARVLARGTVAGGGNALIPAPTAEWDEGAGLALILRRR